MDNQELATATEKAELYTGAILIDAESAIGKDRNKALIVCNSSLAAVEILLRRYGISRQEMMDTYETIWNPVVDALA